jgi:hypothetical protein
MKHKNRKETAASLWKWLDWKLNEINAKLDHILFRLREEDARVYKNESDNYVEEDHSDNFLEEDL